MLRPVRAEKFSKMHQFQLAHLSTLLQMFVHIRNLWYLEFKNRELSQAKTWKSAAKIDLAVQDYCLCAHIRLCYNCSDQK